MTPDVFGCILHPERDRDGYGRIKGRLAHVVAWEKANGPVPEGMTVDHLCRRRACRRLVHLELASRSQQEQRKFWSVRARRKTCAQGHDLRINAAVTPEGGRVCRKCNQEGP